MLYDLNSIRACGDEEFMNHIRAFIVLLTAALIAVLRNKRQILAHSCGYRTEMDRLGVELPSQKGLNNVLVHNS